MHFVCNDSHLTVYVSKQCSKDARFYLFYANFAVRSFAQKNSRKNGHKLITTTRNLRHCFCTFYLNLTSFKLCWNNDVNNLTATLCRFFSRMSICCSWFPSHVFVLFKIFQTVSSCKRSQIKHKRMSQSKAFYIGNPSQLFVLSWNHFFFFFCKSESRTYIYISKIDFWLFANVSNL